MSKPPVKPIKVNIKKLDNYFDNTRKRKGIIYKADPSLGEGEEALRIDGVVIDHVSNFVYLCSNFDEYCDDLIDIQRRLRQGNFALARIKRALWNRYTTRSLEMKIASALIYTTRIYGYETWAVRN